MARPRRTSKQASSTRTNLSTGKFRGQKGAGAYHHGDLRVALLDAAEAVLAAEAPTGLALRALARRVGVTHMAAYHHFPSRADLLAAVAARGYDRLGAALSARAPADDPRQSFQELGVAYVTFAITQPHLFRMMFSSELEPLRTVEPLRTAADRAYAEFTGALRAAAGPAVDVDVAATAAWALVHGLSVLLLDRQLPGHGSTVEGSAQLARTVLRQANLLAPSEGARPRSGR